MHNFQPRTIRMLTNLKGLFTYYVIFGYALGFEKTRPQAAKPPGWRFVCLRPGFFDQGASAAPWTPRLGTSRGLKDKISI